MSKSQKKKEAKKAKQEAAAKEKQAEEAKQAKKEKDKERKQKQKEKKRQEEQALASAEAPRGRPPTRPAKEDKEPKVIKNCIKLDPSFNGKEPCRNHLMGRCEGCDRTHVQFSSGKSRICLAFNDADKGCTRPNCRYEHIGVGKNTVQWLQKQVREASESRGSTPGSEGSQGRKGKGKGGKGKKGKRGASTGSSGSNSGDDDTCRSWKKTGVCGRKAKGLPCSFKHPADQKGGN